MSKGAHEKTPLGYCIVKTNYESFDYPPHKNFTWTINQHHITVDSLKEFKVRAYEGLDTIYFNKPERRDSEMIICDLTEGERYELSYNPCCSDFYFWNANPNMRAKQKSVEFELTGKLKKRKLISGISLEAAFLNANQAVTLTGDYGRSAMFPNRYNVFVEEFEPWHEDSTLARIIDPTTRDELMAFRHLDKKLIDFQYIFVDNEKLKVLVDAKGTVNVKRVK